MKIKASSSALKDALASTLYLAQQRQQLPILNNVRLTADAKALLLKIEATNLEVSITRTIELIDVSEPGEAIFHADSFASIPSGEDVPVEISTDGDKGEISYGGFRLRRTILTEDWPISTDFSDAPMLFTAIVDANELKKHLDSAVGFVQKPSGAKEYLKGISMFSDGGKIYIVGADSTNTSIGKFEPSLVTDGDSKRGSVSFPKDSVRGIKGCWGEVTVVATDKFIQLSWSDGQLRSKVFESEIPHGAIKRGMLGAVESVEAFNWIREIQAADLLAAVDRCGLANEHQASVWTIMSSAMGIEATGPSGSSARDKLKCSFGGTSTIKHKISAHLAMDHIRTCAKFSDTLRVAFINGVMCAILPEGDDSHTSIIALLRSE